MNETNNRLNETKREGGQTYRIRKLKATVNQ